MVRMLEYEYVFIGKFYEMSAKKRRNGSEWGYASRAIWAARFWDSAVAEWSHRGPYHATLKCCSGVQSKAIAPRKPRSAQRPEGNFNLLIKAQLQPEHAFKL
jgi:hypothetical protein